MFVMAAGSPFVFLLHVPDVQELKWKKDNLN